MPSRRVLIALSEDLVGISRLPQILRYAGIDVSVLCAPECLIGHSRYVTERIPCAGAPDAVADALRSCLAQDKNKFDLVLLGDDALIRAVAQRGDEAWARALLPIDPTRAPAPVVYSKTAFAGRLRGSALPLPCSWVCSTASEICAAGAQAGFPLILKEDFGFCGHGVKRFDHAEALDGYARTRSGENACVVQEYIEGPNVTVDALFDRGEVRAWAASRVVRTGNGPFGSSSARRFVRMDELAPVVAEAGRFFGAHGLVGLDFIETPSRKALLLEINFRPTAGHALAAHAGMDFGADLRAMLDGAPAAGSRTLARDSAVLPMFPEDLDRALTERDVGGLARWVFYPSYWRHMPWSDPRLFWRHATRALRRIARYRVRLFDRAVKNGSMLMALCQVVLQCSV